MKRRRIWLVPALLMALPISFGHAHDFGEIRGYRFAPIAAASAPAAHSPKLILTVTDAATGRPTPARFSLIVDGQPYDPPALGTGGLRFESVHERKHQGFVVTYTRGEGPVEVSLLAGAQHVAVHVAKGLEYLPVTLKSDIRGSVVRLSASLERWSDIGEDGWHGADEHVHYERLEPSEDARWLAMLAGDDLAFAHFMVLKGGMRDGLWAIQYAFGKEGQATDSERLIVPGEEYRDAAQGHINLLGITELIEPVSTGGMGIPKITENYPPFIDVFAETRRQGGLGGVAHGAKLGKQPTAVMDAVLGAVDFWEISNGFIYKTDLWYRLMNCGYILPPAAGTDLPNAPGRDPWQPFFGSVRTYARTGEKRDFDSWKNAMKNGEVFVTGGPLIRIEVNGVGPGGTVRLPSGGGEVTIVAELTSPRPLRALEVVFNGKPIEAEASGAQRGPVHVLRVTKKLHITGSGWIAAAGKGARIESLDVDALAHTGVVRVLIDDRPITSPSDAAVLIGMLEIQKDYYQVKGLYQKPEHRERVLGLFDRAIATLRAQIPSETADKQ